MLDPQARQNFYASTPNISKVFHSLSPSLSLSLCVRLSVCSVLWFSNKVAKWFFSGNCSHIMWPNIHFFCVRPNTRPNIFYLVQPSGQRSLPRFSRTALNKSGRVFRWSGGWRRAKTSLCCCSKSCECGKHTQSLNRTRPQPDTSNYRLPVLLQWKSSTWLGSHFFGETPWGVLDPTSVEKNQGSKHFVSVTRR